MRNGLVTGVGIAGLAFLAACSESGDKSSNNTAETQTEATAEENDNSATAAAFGAGNVYRQQNSVAQAVAEANGLVLDDDTLDGGKGGKITYAPAPNYIELGPGPVELDCFNRKPVQAHEFQIIPGNDHYSQVKLTQEGGTGLAWFNVNGYRAVGVEGGQSPLAEAGEALNFKASVPNHEEVNAVIQLQGNVGPGDFVVINGAFYQPNSDNEVLLSSVGGNFEITPGVNQANGESQLIGVSGFTAFMCGDPIKDRPSRVAPVVVEEPVVEPETPTDPTPPVKEPETPVVVTPPEEPEIEPPPPVEDHCATSCEVPVDENSRGELSEIFRLVENGDARLTDFSRGVVKVRHVDGVPFDRQQGQTQRILERLTARYGDDFDSLSEDEQRRAQDVSDLVLGSTPQVYDPR